MQEGDIIKMGKIKFKVKMGAECDDRDSDYEFCDLPSERLSELSSQRLQESR